MSAHHHHDHNSTDNIRLVFFLNLSFAIIEIFGGLWTNSMAILADALHDFGDSFALGLSWYFAYFSQKRRDQHFSYGYRRFSLLSAFLTGLILLLGSIIIVIETLPRLSNPEDIHVAGMIAFSVLGVLVNGIAVFKLRQGKTQNERVVRLHLLEDVLGWIAILVVSLVLLFIYVPILDPILSLFIAAYVLWQAIKNLRETVYIFLQAIPVEIDIKQLEQDLLTDLPLDSIHDIHLWSLDGAYHVLSLHVVVNNELASEQQIELKQHIRKRLLQSHIAHVTIEIEYPQEECGYVDHD